MLHVEYQLKQKFLHIMLWSCACRLMKGRKLPSIGKRNLLTTSIIGGERKVISSESRAWRREAPAKETVILVMPHEDARKHAEQMRSGRRYKGLE